MITLVIGKISQWFIAQIRGVTDSFMQYRYESRYIKCCTKAIKRVRLHLDSNQGRQIAGLVLYH